jgi:hypothetical protein
MNTGPKLAAFLASLTAWLNSRPDMLEMDMAGLLKNVVMLLQVDFVLYFYALQDQMRSSRAFEFFNCGNQVLIPRP